MRYIPNDLRTRIEMLEAIGARDVDELFAVIPSEYRLAAPLRLPCALGEPELTTHLARLADENAAAARRVPILGGGAYHHYLPAAVGHLVSRAEFYTAYTPYQPEISQGTLQAIYEYQTLICQLTAMEVTNASMYDGASATAEAVLMARRVTGKDRVLLSRGLNPLYRQVIATYCRNLGGTLVEVPLDGAGRTDVKRLAALLDDRTACFVVQNPNFLGLIEAGGEWCDLRAASGALLVVAVSEPLSLGLVTPPGAYGADIVAGEGQALGNPLGFGGPYLGILATRTEYIRQMPGRVVGQTVDRAGQTGYCLTLSTREQHIRREKATSNICSNEGLCALTAAVYLSLLGPEGTSSVAALNVMRAAQAREGLARMPGWKLLGDAGVFNEFLAFPADGAAATNERLRAAGFTGGLEVGRWYPEYADGLLFCFTEMIDAAAVSRFLAAAGGRS